MRRVTVLALALLFVFMAAACDGAATSSSAPPDETLPLDTPPADQTDEPTAEPTPEESFPTEPPLTTPEPDESFPPEPPLITPPPGTSIPATSCSENTDEQKFFAEVIGAMDWDVYCPALPDGWHIEGGRWRSAGTGFLEIAYENRSGSRLELWEGSFCDQGSACTFDGDDAGAASFGDLAGTLLAGSDGSWAIVVDPGAAVSYTLIGRSIDESPFRELAANMVRVEP